MSQTKSLLGWSSDPIIICIFYSHWFFRTSRFKTSSNDNLIIPIFKPQHEIECSNYYSECYYPNYERSSISIAFCVNNVSPLNLRWWSWSDNFEIMIIKLQSFSTGPFSIFKHYISLLFSNHRSKCDIYKFHRVIIVSIATSQYTWVIPLI